MKQTFFLAHITARKRAAQAVAEAPDGFQVTISPATRTTAQNARLWASLTDVSKQVVWHGQKLSPESWKHMFSAAMKKQQVVPGIDGGFVVLGQSTSQMSKAELSELLEIIYAFGAEHGVEFHDQQAIAA